MRAHRALAVTAVLVLLSLPAPNVLADEPRQRFLSAPYTDGHANATCLQVLSLTGTCEATAAADATTGSLSFDIGYTSPQDGALPGLGFGRAEAIIVQTDAIASAARAVLYEATLDLNEVVVRSGIVGFSSIEATILVEHDGCSSCTSQAVQPLFTGDEAAVPLRAVMVNQDGGLVPAGATTVRIIVRAEMLDVVLGSARAAFSGTVSQIEAATPSLERTVGVPYLDAVAGRGCQGSVGSTFVCRAAASRDTGRVEFDLGVITPVAGTAPGDGSASGSIDVAVAASPEGEARAIAYELILDVTQADAFAHRSTPTGTASAAVGATTTLSGACSCDLTHGLQVVSHDERVFRLDERLPFVMWTSDVGGAERLMLTLAAGSHLRNASGTALSTLRAVVAEVRIAEIA